MLMADLAFDLYKYEELNYTTYAGDITLRSPAMSISLQKEILQRGLDAIVTF